MKRRAILFTLVVASIASMLPAQAPSPGLDRLPQVYAHLRNAEQMANGAVVIPNDQLLEEAKKLPSDKLKDKCGALVDSVLKASSGGPSKRKPDTMAFLKQAMLRLTLDREETYTDHLNWAYANPNQVPGKIREFAKTIKEALGKM